MGQTTFSGPVVSQNGFIENSFTTAQRDAIVNPTAGLLIYNTTTNTYQVYNGSTWQAAFAPATSPVTYSDGVDFSSGGVDFSGGDSPYLTLTKSYWNNNNDLTVLAQPAGTVYTVVTTGGTGTFTSTGDWFLTGTVGYYNQLGNGSTVPAGFTVTSITFTPAAVVAPTVTSLSTTSGSTAGGTSTTITGTGFSSATAVTFGGTNATSFTIVDNNTINAIAPAHSAGSVSVNVTNSAGTNTANTLYTYSAATTYSISNGDYFNVGLTFNALISNYLELYTPDWNNTTGYNTLLAQTTGQVYTVYVPSIDSNVTFTATSSWMPSGAGLYRLMGNIDTGGGTGTNVAGSITFI